MACIKQVTWDKIREEAIIMAAEEPMLASFFHSTILNHDSLRSALSFQLANKLGSPVMSAMVLREVIETAYRAQPEILDAAATDICAVKERDPAVRYYSTPLLYLKGFHALQGYRVAHWLWQQGRHSLAVFLQNQISVVFSVDVHPAAQIGRGIGGGSNHRHGRHHGMARQRGRKGLLRVGGESRRQGNASQRNAGSQAIQREESRHGGKGSQNERRHLAGGM